MGAPSDKSANPVALVLARPLWAGYQHLQGLEQSLSSALALPQGPAGADGEGEGRGSTEGRSAARPC